MKIPKAFWVVGIVMAFLFGSLSALAGAGIMIFMNYLEGQSQTIKEEWGQVPAKVIHSKVAQRQSENATVYRPEIRYEFTVDGKTYKADQYGLVKWSSSNWSEHQRVVDEHPVGREITVYYNPEDPYDAVIDPSFSREGCFGYIAIYLAVQGFVFLTAGTIGVFVLRRLGPPGRGQGAGPPA